MIVLFHKCLCLLYYLFVNGWNVDRKRAFQLPSTFGPGSMTKEAQQMPLLEDSSCYSIATASLANNSAVAWMHVGEFGIAYQLLSGAVDSLLRYQDGTSHIVPIQAPTGRSSSRERSCCATDYVGIRNNSGLLRPFVSCTVSKPPTRNDESNSFVLFDRSLIVETTLALDRQTPDLVQAAIHYNLALLYQLESVNSGKSLYAKHADLWYEAANFSINIAIDRGACTECGASLMLLAIWNNRVHIRCYSIIDLSSADVFIHLMKGILQQYTPGVTMPLPDLRIFFLNILVLTDCNGTVVGSAAAA